MDLGRSAFGETHYLDDATGDRVYSMRHIEAELSAFGEACQQCAAVRRCSGVAREYAEQHGVGELAPFLGMVASTLPLPGAISARHEPPIFLMAGRRPTHEEHVVTLSRLALPTGGDDDQRRHAITVACNEALGAAILACPEQYFWYHRRWREYPPIQAPSAGA